MRMKKSRYIFLSMLAILSLVSCQNEAGNDGSLTYVNASDPGTATIRIFKNDNSSDPKGRYVSPTNAKIDLTYESISGTLSNNRTVCPSNGDVNLLVIPVHIPGSEEYKTDKVKEDIDAMFFGENNDKLGFKSVKEFYMESSYGKLNFSGKVTDWYDSAKSNIKSAADITRGQDGTIVKILEDACSWAINEQKINLQEFDKNRDGAIDAVWLVYDHLDYTTESKKLLKDGKVNEASAVNQSYWNFTGWDYNLELADYEKNKDAQPAPSGFSWASFDMMYTSYCKQESFTYGSMKYDLPVWDESTKLDSHTFIHETGHLLGLDDYYATDATSYNPAGETTMMDQNVYDLDSYSKMLLGWVKPYVVYGSSEIVLPKATSSDRAVIVIPSNYEDISKSVSRFYSREDNKDKKFSYTFNPFSEYLMIDLYSPDGLNKQDVYGTYINGRESLGEMTRTGVRIYHVDSRIFKCIVKNTDNGQKFYYDQDDLTWNGEQLANDEAIFMPISNDKTGAEAFQLSTSYDPFDRIRLLEATQNNTFSYGGHASDDTLFNVDSKEFSIEDFGYSFFNSNYSFNDGNNLPFKVKVNTLKEIEND